MYMRVRARLASGVQGSLYSHRVLPKNSNFFLSASGRKYEPWINVGPKKREVLPGLEPGLQGSEPWVLTNYTIEPRLRELEKTKFQDLL